MGESALSLLVWGILPVFLLQRSGRRRPARALIWVFSSTTVLLTAAGAVGVALGAAHLLVWGAAAVVLSAHDFSLRSAERRYRAQRRGLKALLREREASDEGLASSLLESSQKLERMQNRFALVQAMATKLEAGEILRTLGGLWCGVPSVKRGALFQRRPNGNWAAVFAKGVDDPPSWARVLGDHPTIGHLRRVRRYNTGEGDSVLKKMGAVPPFVAVPFVWEEDMMALGLWEFDAPPPEEIFDGFGVERKLVSIGLRRAFLYDLMTERSRHDALTGAFLRRTFMERLEESLRRVQRYRTPISLALLDLDRFKALNDRWGHLVGDRALVHLAQTARRLATPGISMGRLGGDEFAFLFELPALDEARRWLESLAEALRLDPLREGGEEIPLSISVGLAPAPVQERLLVEDLIRRADEALYAAKREGRGRIVLHAAEAKEAS
jgi:diguanylate cyclase (GGDEF)-like protein